MKTYVVHYSAGVCGTDRNEKVEADSEEDAVEQIEDTAWDWREQFADEEEDLEIEPELDIYAELYDPAKHDGLF